MAVHPAQLQEELEARHASHVAAVGVPRHRGGAVNSRGAGGCSREGDLQQTWRGQSLFCVQTLGQLAAQIPPQQSGVFVAPMQSSDDVHERGHVAFDGLRHTPSVVSAGSTVDADVQQISPVNVLQSESAEHPLGHSFCAVQIGVW
jgi:hypothetical protein